MEYKKVLTIQDISCVGQCSLTVALPILSACGLEAAILPSAILSTHTAGFTGYTFRDLTDDIPGIVEHWRREGIAFNAIYSGYLGLAAEPVGPEIFRHIVPPCGIAAENVDKVPGCGGRPSQSASLTALPEGEPRV